MADPQIFAVLKSRMDYVNQREKLLSENVANADTPGYAPRDLKPFNFASALEHASAAGGAALAMTQVGHLSGANGSGGGEFRADTGPDTEIRVDGNQVVLEDQMMKLTQARIDYEAAVDFYQQTNTLLNTAARSPGKVA